MQEMHKAVQKEIVNLAYRGFFFFLGGGGGVGVEFVWFECVGY